MAWTPKYNALNLRSIADNLIEYWKDNQVEVFAWAGDADLPPIKAFTDVLIQGPVFPAVALSNDLDAVDYTGDVLNAGYQPIFSLMVVNKDPSIAMQHARLYSRALISMLLNCPAATLLANTGVISTEVVIDDTATNFLEIMADEEEVTYMQRVDIQATIRVQASLFA